ncbi:GspE/PulE family protein (plasmid) [Rossellomorea sp. AcN35-11]|nr:GspE/PulE family protein [Rossellomorea aquimaris]WJV32311.1 GspE/PulE family protein [Rossellomorea sp. AcN35-11]
MKKSTEDMLLEAKIITQEQLEAAQNHPTNKLKTLEQSLIELEMTTENNISKTREQHENSVNLSLYDINYNFVKVVPEKYLRSNIVIPYYQDNEKGIVYIAMTSTSNYSVIDDIRSFYGARRVITKIADEESILNTLDEIFKSLNSFDNESFSFEIIDSEEEEEEEEELLDDQSPIIKLVNDIISKAIISNISDIHIEPQLKSDTRVRLRLDGELVDYTTVPRKWHSQLISRLKIMANLDTSNRLEPQDGEIRFKYNNRLINLRLSTLPLMTKEKIVIRLLGNASSIKPLEEIGFNEESYTMIVDALNKKKGMILVTGPTGSGKSSTLYSALNRINKSNINITTIEDPVEIKMPGLNQVQINKRLTFSSVLRSILRQDPDVVMLGEIRDAETAQIAIKAAFTGHLLLSTLHTNDSVSTILRLLDLGVEPYFLVDALTLVISQRLVRRICPHCKVDDPENTVILSNMLGEEIDGSLKKGTGCKKCSHTGYSGRFVVQEVLDVQLIKDHIIRGDVTKYKVEKTLFKDGLEKAKKGLTTLDEVLPLR